MGIWPSKRVRTTLSLSSEFNSSCDSAFSHCRSLTQHAFPGVFPYQLADASNHLHGTLSSSNYPLIRKWLPSPPTQSQVDQALRVTTRRHPTESKSDSDQDQTLGPDQFKEWAVELFADAVLSNAGKEVLRRVPIGVGIAGVGVAARSGKDVVGTAIGLYALGVATSIYFSLSA